jgi:hypothetical protein
MKIIRSCNRGANLKKLYLQFYQTLTPTGLDTVLRACPALVDLELSATYFMEVVRVDLLLFGVVQFTYPEI